MRKLVAVIVLSLSMLFPGFSWAAGMKAPGLEDGSVDVDAAAKAKEREGKTGTSNENAARGLEHVNDALKGQAGKDRSVIEPKEPKGPKEPKEPKEPKRKD